MTPALAARLPWTNLGDLNDDLLHLARRATFGLTTELTEEIHRLGREQWLTQQLHPLSLSDGAVYEIERRFPGTVMPVAAARAALASGRLTASATIDAYPQAALARACWSSRQLNEVMTSFWDEFFGIGINDVAADSRAHLDVILRAGALGRFSDLLLAVTTHPATLRLLGTHASSGERPSLLHGALLLERHSMGRTQSAKAHLQAARLLTGLTLEPLSGEFQYSSARRYVGAVEVAGFKAPKVSTDAGYDVTVNFVEYLAKSPITAERLVWQLAQRFIGPSASRKLVLSLRDVYLKSHTSIAAVLRAIFASQDFARAPRQLIRRPLEDLIASVRILDVAMDDAGTVGIRGLAALAESVGQPSRGAGAPEQDLASIGAQAALLGAHFGLAAGVSPDGLSYRTWRHHFGQELPGTYRDLVEAMGQRLTYRMPSAVERDAILSLLGRKGSAEPQRADLNYEIRQIITVLLSSPAHLRY